MIEDAVNTAGAGAARKSSMVKKLLEKKSQVSLLVSAGVNNSIDDSKTKTKKEKESHFLK